MLAFLGSLASILDEFNDDDESFFNRARNGLFTNAIDCPLHMGCDADEDDDDDEAVADELVTGLVKLYDDDVVDDGDEEDDDDEEEDGMDENVWL